MIHRIILLTIKNATITYLLIIINLKNIFKVYEHTITEKIIFFKFFFSSVFSKCC